MRAVARRPSPANLGVPGHALTRHAWPSHAKPALPCLVQLLGQEHPPTGGTYTIPYGQRDNKQGKPPMTSSAARYYASCEPKGDPHARFTDGLDGVVINGVEVGQEHRLRLRRLHERLRARERLLEPLQADEGQRS
jgi:hypothetical protein